MSKRIPPVLARLAVLCLCLACSTLSARAQSQATVIQRELARLKAGLPGVDAKMSPLTGAVEVLRNTRGSLSGPARGVSGSLAAARASARAATNC